MLRTSDVVVATTIAIAGGLGAAIDLKTRRVPNVLTLLLALFGLILAAAHGSGQTLGTALAGCAVAFAIMLPAHLVGATGGGDVKLGGPALPRPCGGGLWPRRVEETTTAHACRRPTCCNFIRTPSRANPLQG